VIAIDARSMKVIQELATGGASLHGMALTADGQKLYSSDAGSHVHEFMVGADGRLSEGRNLALDRDAYACGLALTPDGSRLLVCQNKLNNLAVLNLATGAIDRRIQTGIAPYAVKLSPNGKIAYVSNWGGHLALPGERTALSAGTPTPVDDRGVALTGSVSFLDLASGTEIAQVDTGRHAADLALTQDGRALFVANANDDTVSVIDTAAKKVCSNILVRPEPDMPYGSASNALALSQDERTLFVANGGNNAVAVVDVSAVQQAREKSKEPAWSGWMVHGLKPGESVVKGFIPSGWYPGALARYQNEIFVANVKGLGSRAGNGQYDKAYLGSIDRITIPDRSQLSRYTIRVRAQSLIPSVLQAYRPARPGRAPAPVPERVGEPSPIKHIIYVIKENRTYDQLFGDMKQAHGDPALVQFGR
jgi:YVTN family beta-propeller protein